MRIVIGGASGMIGTELARQLAARGDEVVRLVRRPVAAAGEVPWDPASGRLDAAALAGADAVVNLSGATLSRLPWTASYRERILASRLAATAAITGALHELSAAGQRVPALVSGSAVGVYGSRPGEELTEASAPGDGFLAEVVRRWEDAAGAAPAGARVVLARTGLVLGPGGALRPLRVIARLGVAGPIGGGRQHWPWISLNDEAAALVHLIGSTLSGPVNLVGPAPASSAEVVDALARALRRPSGLPLPGWAVRAVMGEAGRELLLSDQCVRPSALLADGFVFRDSTVQDALAALSRG